VIFEGAEKKIEIIVNQSIGDLRQKGRSYWVAIVSSCGAEIISELHNKSMSAYLLSESSLFVWKNSFLMITCGRTSLVNSLVQVINDFGVKNIEAAIYQRKNEYYSHLQLTSFYQDIREIMNILPGKAWRLGDLDGHHNLVFHYCPRNSFPQNDKTFELLMYNIDPLIGNRLRDKNISSNKIRSFLGIDKIFNGFTIDDHTFCPHGYSLNAIRGEDYFTIHLTPEEEGSYVSFETNVNPLNKKEIIYKFLNTLYPKSFDVISFNLGVMSETENYIEVYQCRQKLSQDLSVDFLQFVTRNTSMKASAFEVIF